MPNKTDLTTFLFQDQWDLQLWIVRDKINNN